MSSAKLATAPTSRRRARDHASMSNAQHDPGSDDEAMSDAVDEEDDEEAEKDSAEEELEKLVFGDKVGFTEGLKKFKRQGDDRLEPKPLAAEAGDRDEDEEDDQGLTGVDDADLFFLDSGPVDHGESALAPHAESLARLNEGDDTISGGRPPAWEDSDDERMRVSLISIPRLRKLRLYEGEDVISGKEYTRRLRRQYELLNPRPEWANWAASKENARKRRKRDSNTSGGDADADSAVSDMDIDADDDAEYNAKPLSKLLRSAQPLVRTTQTLPNKRIKLRQEVIGIERMKDIGPTQPSPITSLSIHPTMPLLLSSGTSATLYLHHLLPHPAPPDQPNPLITSLHLKHTPLTTTAFSPQGTGDPKIYLSSRRRYFHTWDLPSGRIAKTTRIYGQQDTQRSMETLKPSPCGRYIGLLGSTRKAGSGVVNVVDAKTQQWVAQVRVESRKGVADFEWWGDGEGLCVVGRGGEVSEWSVAEGRIVCRWQDEGAVGTTTVALGGHRSSAAAAVQQSLGPDRWIALGSTSGIVNMYDRHAWPLSAGSASADAASPAQRLPPPNPKPTRTFDNLTTPVSHLAFSPCGQLFAFASRWKRDALRLAHLPSCTVYRNWPTGRTPLGRISALALGEYEEAQGGGSQGQKRIVVGVGNEAGVLRAWEVTA